LVKKGKKWQVYDMVIEGVSLVENYRSQFQSFCNLGALIDRLKKMNKDT
jgi:ABC-type transport system involved in resistance to organic solvents, auxiliary component